MSAVVPIAQAAADEPQDIAVMLTGGGARAAYQVGLLRGMARRYPHLRFDIVTGVSAGAINAIFLAARQGTLREKTDDLADLWCQLDCSHVYRIDWTSFIPFRAAVSSVFPRTRWRHPGGLVDTLPLRHLMMKILGCGPHEPIPGVLENLRSGDLQAVALMTLDYSTGQTVRWVQGRRIDVFEGPNRRSASTKMTVDHVLASSALPFIFPAVRIGSEWHGDGGIRLAAPLSPAVHLGARRIVVMSTSYQPTPEEAQAPEIRGYPPAAQILSQLVNAVFLDVIDEDVLRMERMNQMIRKLDPEERGGFRPIDLLVLRPSMDLGKLAAKHEDNLPRHLKVLTRALGTKTTESPDFISLLMFEPGYTRALIELGEHDAELRMDDIRAFLGEVGEQAVAL